MPENRLLINYQDEHRPEKLLSSAGILPILDFSMRCGLYKYFQRYLDVYSDQGWSPSMIALGSFLLNVLGGESVSDIDHLESDKGLCSVIDQNRYQITGINDRRFLNRFRRGLARTFPGDNGFHNYMEHYHNESQEVRRKKLLDEEDQRSFIPLPNKYLSKLMDYLCHLAHFAQVNNPVSRATLDVDGAVFFSNKESAFFSYKKGKGFFPMNAYWFEQPMVIHSEFRDGNVGNDFELLRFVKKAFSHVPSDIEERYFRMDSKGYVMEVLEYLHGEGIGFSVSVPSCKSLRHSVYRLDESEWQRLSLTKDQYLRFKKSGDIDEEQGWEWQEMDYVGDAASTDAYRYVVIRSRIPDQKLLIDPDEANQSYEGNKTYRKKGVLYRFRVIVTNREDLSGDELFHWHNERCGYSEMAHSVMKKDFTASRFPSGKFGANAFWWLMMIISLNIMSLYKRLVLGDEWVHRRMKVIRFRFIYIAGRIIKKARQLIVKVGNSDMFRRFTKTIGSLKWVPI